MLCSNCYKKIPEGEEVSKSGSNHFFGSFAFFFIIGMIVLIVKPH